MTSLPVSVVVVSRDRPALLLRCLTGLSQVQYRPFEIVVVADPAGCAAVKASPLAGSVKLVSYDAANISGARNVGIAHAAGEVVAFIDDDAVPEPTWLHYLAAPFQREDVAAVGGYVRGRNGISQQWGARGLDAQGHTHPLQLDSRRATVLHPPKGRAVKTEGTNMAVRRDVLVALGGFDPGFHYYLDETDLNLRLAHAGHATAIAPLAEVHHGFAANRLRDARRVPRDLTEMGASWAVFQRKHMPQAARAEHWAALRAAERQRLLGHMVSGGLGPDDILRLMRGLERGYREGLDRPRATVRLARHPEAAFQPVDFAPRSATLIATRPLHRARDYAEARARVESGKEIVTLLNLSPDTRFHRVYFDPCGLWVQTGGLFGKSERNEPLFRMTSRSRRVEKEKLRVASQRGFRES